MIRRGLIAAALVSLCFAVVSKQVRAQDCTGPEADIGSVIFNTDFDVFQGCTARGWIAWHDLPPDPCDPDENPSPGMVCLNGSIYAGLSPDGNVPMYTTPGDAPSLLEWGSSGTTRGTTSVTAGESNTGTLAAFGASAHPAAHYCDSLSAHGSDDWYLPAKDELDVLYDNKNAGSLNNTFNETGSDYAKWYWSSSEIAANSPWAQIFSNGNKSGTIKSNALAVRCVRR